MPEIIGVVSKPVFNTDVFKLGKAIRVKRTLGRYTDQQPFDAIVVESTDLKLEVAYWNPREFEMRDESIFIENVRSGHVEIQLLDVVKEEIK